MAVRRRSSRSAGVAVSPGSDGLGVISSDRVHLWCRQLEPSPDAVAAEYALLSPDECARAERLVRAPARDRYVLSRAGLRRVLAAYLEVDPRMPAFSYSAHGKPFMENSELSFNMSHSGDRAAYAVSRTRDTGIDLEFLGRRVARAQVAKRFYAQEEQAALEAAEEGDRDRTFFSIWTLKEAYLKAQGTGISVPLDSFAVLSAGEDSALLRQDGDPHAAQRWKLVAVELEGGYVAAVCAAGKDWELERRDWPPA